jgi:hypothetical protein
MPCDFSFLGRPLSRSFELRVVSVEPGGEHLYVEEEWRRARSISRRFAARAATSSAVPSCA